MYFLFTDGPGGLISGGEGRGLYAEDPALARPGGSRARPTNPDMLSSYPPRGFLTEASFVDAILLGVVFVFYRFLYNLTYSTNIMTSLDSQNPEVRLDNLCFILYWFNVLLARKDFVLTE